MINILQFATDKRKAITLFITEGYLSEKCLFSVNIDTEKAETTGKEFLIQNGATKKYIGKFSALNTYFSTTGAYLDFENIEKEQESFYRIFINKNGYFTGWEVIE